MDIRRLRTAEEWNARGAENLPGLLGIVFEKVESAEVVAKVTVRKALMAPNGYLHAGTVVTLADTCCGYGTVMSLPEGASGFTTIELKSNFFGSAREGTLVCVARPLHLPAQGSKGPASAGSLERESGPSGDCYQRVPIGARRRVGEQSEARDHDKRRVPRERPRVASPRRAEKAGSRAECSGQMPHEAARSLIGSRARLLTLGSTRGLRR